MFNYIIVILVLFFTNVNAEVKVLSFAGSTRTNSFHKMLSIESASLAEQLGAIVTTIDLKDYEIPFYDADLEAKNGMPATVSQLRKLMIESEIIIIASPEYNGSLTAVLKNVIDWTSRSEDGGSSRAAFKDKTFLLMSTSPGANGGAKGLIHLKTILETIGGDICDQQIVIPHSYNAFDQNGHLKNAKIRREIENIIKTTIQKKITPEQ